MEMSEKFLLNCDDVRECLPFFHLLFDSNKIGVMVTDAEGILIYFNEAQQQLDELPAGEVLGRKLYEVYSFTIDNSPGMTVLRTETPVVDTCHFYRTRRGKMVYASCDIYPLHTGCGHLLGAICYSQGYSTVVNHLKSIRPHMSATAKAGLESRKTGTERAHYSFSSLVGRNPDLQEAVRMARLAARSRSPVMLVGETGVGKEIFAQALHYESERQKHAYTALNCSAVPETLLEGILFGTAKGAFTGAVDKAGLFEVSDRGTLFLDELDSMPINLQSKLLRVLQERKIRRVGDIGERDVDLKIVSSVRSDPLELIKDGVLRADFYYRLGVVRIRIPPLRERLDDMPLLINHFLKKHSPASSAPPRLDERLREALTVHIWPGNVRELEHVLEAMLNLAPDSETLSLEHLLRACPELARIDLLGGNLGLRPPARPSNGRRPGGEGAGQEPPPFFSDQAPSAPAVSRTLIDAQRNSEREALVNALSTSSGNRSLAARLLGISPQSLYYKMKKYKLQAADYIPGAI